MRRILAVVLLVLALPALAAADCEKKSTKGKGGSGVHRADRDSGVKGNRKKPRCTRDCRAILIRISGQGNRLGNKAYVHIRVDDVDSGEYEETKPLTAQSLTYKAEIIYSAGERLNIRVEADGYGGNLIRIRMYRNFEGTRELCNQGYAETNTCTTLTG